MRKLFLFSGALLGLIFAPVGNTQEQDKTEQVSKHLGMLRTLNTLEVGYRKQYGHFGDREQILTYLRASGAIPIQGIEPFEHLQSFQLSVTVSSDGVHYQASLTPLLDDANKAGWCDKAGFIDDRAVIFLGTSLGCEVTRK
jgi:hypothetical protein